MKTVHTDVRKCKSLQESLCTKALKHMASLRKDTKDIYFSFIVYDMVTYIPQLE